jgi:hypothetical protein
MYPAHILPHVPCLRRRKCTTRLGGLAHAHGKDRTGVPHPPVALGALRTFLERGGELCVGECN